MAQTVRLVNPLAQINDLLLSAVSPVDTESISLASALGRILASDLTALEDVPDFERSPLDGYAFRASDTASASPEHPVTLRILEEIAAGSVSHIPVTPGTAVKVLTGSPIPSGADAVTRYESVRFTDTEVTLTEPFCSGQNVIAVGEDVRRGTVLAHAGSVIDYGTAGTLAGQNQANVTVFRRPRVGVITTGSELLSLGEAPQSGKIYDTSRYTISAALASLGCEPVFLASVADSADAIAAHIRSAVTNCDALFLTGGVSAGDYDLTPTALGLAGAEIIYSGGALRPCRYALLEGRLIGALTGSPASAATDLFLAAEPALKKLCGLMDCAHRLSEVVLTEGIGKPKRGLRALRGRVSIEDGEAHMHLSAGQGHVMVSGLIGCNAVALIAGGTAPAAGERVPAILF